MKKYTFVNWDTDSGPPYQRFAIHTTYEPPRDVDAAQQSYDQTSRRIVLEGLCRVLGTEVIPACENASQSFVSFVTFSYVGYIRWGVSVTVPRLKRYVAHFQAVEFLSRLQH